MSLKNVQPLGSLVVVKSKRERRNLSISTAFNLQTLQIVDPPKANAFITCLLVFQSKYLLLKIKIKKMSLLTFFLEMEEELFVKG